MFDLESLDRAGVGLGAVTGTVVGHDPLHGHAQRCEPCDRTFQEPDAGFRGLVREDLDVRGAAGVIDSDVAVLETPTDRRTFAGLVAAGHAVTGPVETAESLDVDVNELARMAPAIPVRRFGR